MTQLHEGAAPLRAHLRAVDRPATAPGHSAVEPPARLPGLFVSCDVDGYCRMASAGLQEWFGLCPDDVVGRPVGEVIGARLDAVNRPYVAAALEGHEQVLETSVRDRVGRERHFEVTYVPDLAVDGSVQGAFIQADDVTGRVRAQSTLADAQEMAGLGSWSWERGVGFFASEQTARILGRDPSGWGTSPEAVAVSIHAEDLPWLTERFRAALLGGGGWEARHRVVRPDGEVRHLHSRLRVELGTDCRPLRVWGTLLDVTEQTRLLEAVEAHNQRLGDTMAMLGHDVRQPLTAVLGFLDEASQALRAEDADPAGAAARDRLLRACIDKAGRAGQRMRRLVDDILAVASVDAGTLVARPERVRLAALLNDVAEEVRIALTVTGAEGVWVRADLFHLRQALTNLMVNASRYGRPPFEVTVTVTGAWVEIQVADHGDGVSADFVPDLFGRFSRGAGPGRGDGAGAGLGLHLVRSLVEANGGSVRYAGAPGEGARFVVTLPSA